MAQNQTRFFFSLAPGTVFNRLTKFEMSTRERPCAGTVRAYPFAKKHKPVSDDDYTHANLGGFFFFTGMVELAFSHFFKNIKVDNGIARG